METTTATCEHNIAENFSPEMIWNLTQEIGNGQRQLVSKKAATLR
jgi:hypothetical protein